MTEPPEHTVYPDQLVVFIGGFGGPNYRLTWDDGALRYQRGEFAPPVAGEGTAQVLEPSESQWRHFWAEMEAVEVWNWNESYHAPGILDGTQWEVEIQRGGRRVEASGSNRYPGYREEGVEDGTRTKRFERFTVAVRELVGGRPFS